MYCPQCGTRFRFRNTFCPDCRVGLVEHPPVAAAAPEAETPLTRVFVSENAALIALAQSLLDSEDIDCMTRGSALRGLGMGARPVEFWVRAEDAERATALLHDLREAPGPAERAPEDET